MIFSTRTKRMLLSLTFLALVLTLAAPSSFATSQSQDEPKVLKVVFSQTVGLTEVDENGYHVGLIFDYLNEISKYTNWEYEYYESSPEEMHSTFLTGEYDLMGGTYYLPELEEYYAYPKYSAGISRAALLSRWDDNNLKSYDLSSLNGKVIGVYEKATQKIDYLKEFLASNNIDCKLNYYAYDDMQKGTLYHLLESGEIDALLGNATEKHSQFRILASFRAQPYYIVTTPDNPLVLEGLNMALEIIMDAYPTFADERYEANFPDIFNVDPQLNEEELAYIAEKHTVTVAAVRQWHPFFCTLNNSSPHNGLVPELFEKISGFTGLKFEFVYADTYAGAIRLVQEGRADILGCYLDSDESAQAQGLALTKSFVSMNNVALRNNYASFPGENLVGGILEGRTLPAEINANEIKYYPSTRAGIEAVERGEADFIYGLAVAIEQGSQGGHFRNVVPVSLVNNNTGVSIALPRPVTPQLLTVLNKAISSLSVKEREAMLDRNLVSISTSSWSLTSIIYSNPISFMAVVAVFLLLVMTVVFTLMRAKVNRSLMESELRKAEADSKAKGEFLSRMSHEIRTPMNAIVGLTDLTCMLPELPVRVAENLNKIRSSSQYLLELLSNILDMSRIESGMMTIAMERFSLQDMLAGIEEMMKTQAAQHQINYSCRQDVTHKFLVGDSIRLRQVLINLLSNAIKFTPAGGSVCMLVEERACEGQTAEYRFSVKDTGTGISPEFQERIFGAFEQEGSNLSKSEGSGLGLAISYNIVCLMGGTLQVRSQPRQGSEFFFTLRFSLGDKPESGEAHSGALDSLEGLRILLAEDNQLNAEIAMELLRIQGVSVEWVADGQQAVELFTNSPPGHFQVILMDIQMPVKNGLEAAREIRASGHPGAGSIPIIAMTANSFKEDIEAALAAGMAGFIPKPVDTAYLYKVLRETLAEQSGTGQDSGEGS